MELAGIKLFLWWLFDGSAWAVGGLDCLLLFCGFGLCT